MRWYSHSWRNSLWRRSLRESGVSSIPGDSFDGHIPITAVVAKLLWFLELICRNRKHQRLIIVYLENDYQWLFLVCWHNCTPHCFLNMNLLKHNRIAPVLVTISPNGWRNPSMWVGSFKIFIMVYNTCAGWSKTD